jgi:hypothetical protein
MVVCTSAGGEIKKSTSDGRGKSRAKLPELRFRVLRYARGLRTLISANDSPAMVEKSRAFADAGFFDDEHIRALLTLQLLEIQLHVHFVLENLHVIIVAPPWCTEYYFLAG